MVDLPAPERPVNHSTHGLLALERGARARLVDVERLPVDVLRAAQREVEQAGADGGVGQPVDQDEAAGVAVLRVGVEGDRPVELEVADADLVELERLGGEVLERVDVDLVLGLGDRRGDRAARRSSAGTCGPGSSGSSPIQTIVRLELVGDARRRVGGGEHVAAADVDLVGERQRDRLPGDRLVEVAVHA